MSTSHPPLPSAELAVTLGGVDLEVTLRTGARERVKVRQLPIRLLREWSEIQGDEAALAELYCDKLNRESAAQIRKLRADEFALLQLLSRASDSGQLQKTSEELAMTRAAIDKLERTPRWDDELVPESHDEIIRIGEALNRPRFDRWLENRHKAIGHLKETYQKHLPDHPLAQGAPAPSSNGEVVKVPVTDSRNSSPTPA